MKLFARVFDRSGRRASNQSKLLLLNPANTFYVLRSPQKNSDVEGVCRDSDSPCPHIHMVTQAGTVPVPTALSAIPGFFCFLLLAFSIPLRAATLPAGFTETQVASGISSPTAMAFAPDGRLFVCQQGGQLRVIKNGSLLATPFITVNTVADGERGLLGVAFDPNFTSNNFLYVYYTAQTPSPHNRVSRFTANGDVAVPGSEVVIFELNNLSSATNHNGGAIHFGEDGKLYIAVGENANPANSQTLSNLLGKILRINPDGTIPVDNPFFNTATGNNRAIWVMGLRNPFTFDFQPVTRRMFINDVGQSAWEEIDDGIAGSNYGWPTCEGTCSNQSFRNPLYQYAHSGAAVTGCAITGGAFYNPAVNQFPSDYVGKYFFADLCGGWIKRFDPSTGTVTDFASGINQPVDLKVGPDGSLYYLAIGSAAVFKVTATTTGQAPSITTQPVNQTVTEGQSATFSVAASGTSPLGYKWQRNGVDIAGATSQSYTFTATLADQGAKFRAVVTNSFGSATSNEATLTVNALPASVQFSAAGYSAGEGSGSVQITVTRVNNTGADVFVDYAANGGTASERSDYETLVGTLHFAPNETSKILTVLLGEDGFVEGSETVNLMLSNVRGGALGNPSTATLTITDNDTAPSSNPIAQTSVFVRQHYHDFLNREPDPPGFQGWQNILNNCPQSGKDANGIFCDRIEVSSDFFRSLEFQDRGYFVYRFYSASFGRIPHYAEFMPDMSRVSGFQSTTEEEASKVAFIDNFMLRQEFRNRYDSVTDPRAFVTALESAAGVVLSNRETLIADLAAGRKTRAQVLRAVAESTEVYQKYYNQAFVVMQYFGYLRRDPDILYLQWIDTLNRTGDYRVMVNGFINSVEYNSRFGQ
jgi:glucose/arabinose dehydrogenase